MRAWAVRRALSSASSAAVSAPQQAQGVEQGRQMAGLDATLGQRQLVGLLVQRIEHLTAQAQRCLLGGDVAPGGLQLEHLDVATDQQGHRQRATMAGGGLSGVVHQLEQDHQGRGEHGQRAAPQGQGMARPCARWHECAKTWRAPRVNDLGGHSLWWIR
jgi:hypothetical protein